ncbi:Neutral/alkaline non-lysosomal ceramidase [Polystyrenella longa]|uniref:Neutral/alkaline non-lysosomal ceramidase n=1 Tax=Polystyrenella longa TaxID=2528007 RepID=A0A518CM26_9PLAN|nr:neutral/alkaline non-lysosomal ceramidase N-terminal domain-containing protein [Polystyrenella longa]QDU80272.1 Neutral/alkaline non-lysosomal ceramidase [Polystyrenella longa]
MIKLIGRTASLLACFSFLLLGTHLQAGWQAGAAKIVITPEEDMWMAGYASRKTPSEGVLQDLHAKSLVLADDEGNKIVMVTTDLVGIPRIIRENVVSAVSKKHQLRPDQILLNASHTHCGPELRPSKSTIYELDPAIAAQCHEYRLALEKKIEQVISESLKDLEPVDVTYTYGRAGFAMNRRYPLPNGSFKNSPYPAGPVQQQVPVLTAKTAEGGLKAILFGYACHNTTTGIMQFNGDYAGAAQAILEKSHPGTIALFMEGCGGDQNPYPRGQEKNIEQHGTALALAVETALQDIRPTPLTGKIETVLGEVPIPFAKMPTRSELEEKLEDGNVYVRRHARLMLNRLDTEGSIPAEYPYMVQCLQLGNELTMVALAGEVVVDYDHLIREQLPVKNLWIAGYSNDVFGYVPSLRVLKEGGYEGGEAMIYSNLPGPFADSVEDRILGEVQKLYGELENEKSAP